MTGRWLSRTPRCPEQHQRPTTQLFDATSPTEISAIPYGYGKLPETTAGFNFNLTPPERRYLASSEINYVSAGGGFQPSKGGVP